MARKSAPIGIYDSGIGGLTVWLALRRLLPDDLIYYADTAHIPYGEKSRAQILSYSYTILSFFADLGVKAVIAACNTSSALAVPVLRPLSDFPLFDVISPAVDLAVRSTVNKTVGVMATAATVQSGVYQRMISSALPESKVVAQACPRLVPLVEDGKFNGPEVEHAVEEYVAPILKAGADTLILGCTHYPLLLPVIHRYVGTRMTIVDPADQTASNVVRWLAENNGVPPSACGGDQFWVSGDKDIFRQKASVLLGTSVESVYTHHPEECESPWRWLSEESFLERGSDHERMEW